MSAGAALSEGQSLILPSGVTKSAHNASTFQPYDASEAMGDTLPTTPKPPKTPKCGAFGQILQTAVTIAITQLLSMTPLAPVAPILGNAAGQLFGMATGIQQGGFNWKSLGMTALTIALPNPGGFIGGALNNAAAQGIGVAIGLQDKFSWSGVAAAGVGSALSAATQLGYINFGKGALGDILATSADVLAQAATRSIIDGNSFGDNLIASLPSALGNLAGRALAAGVGTAFDGKTGGAASSIHEAGHVDPKAVQQTVGNGMAGDVVTIYSGKAAADEIIRKANAGLGLVGNDGKLIRQVSRAETEKYQIEAMTGIRAELAGRAVSESSPTEFTSTAGKTIHYSKGGLNEADYLISHGFENDKGGYGDLVRQEWGVKLAELRATDPDDKFYASLTAAEYYADHLASNLAGKSAGRENAVMFMLGHRAGIGDAGSGFMAEVAGLVAGKLRANVEISTLQLSNGYVEPWAQQFDAGFSTGANSEVLHQANLRENRRLDAWYNGGLQAYAAERGRQEAWRPFQVAAFGATTAAGIVAAPIAIEQGSAYAAANYGWASSRTGALLAKSGIGGSFNLGYSSLTTAVYEGRSLTWGEGIASIGTGALFAPAMLGVEKLFSAPARGAINGSLSGFSGDLAAQYIDLGGNPNFRLNSDRLFINTVISGTAGAVGGTANTYYSYRPSIGNAQSFGAGFDYGVRLQAHASPQSGAAYITQFHLDGVKVLVKKD